MMKDMHSETKVLVAFDSQTITTDTTTVGNELEPADLAGFESVTFVFSMGVHTNGTFTPLVEAKPTGGAYAAVADEDLLPLGTGQEAAAVLDATNAITKLGYRGDPEVSLRVSVVSAGGTASGAGVHATAVLQHPTHAPVA